MLGERIGIHRKSCTAARRELRGSIELGPPCIFEISSDKSYNLSTRPAHAGEIILNESRPRVRP